MSNSLWPSGLQLTRRLCPWDFPGKNTGVGCHFLLQGIFLTQGSNLHILLDWQILYHWATREAQLSRGWDPSPKKWFLPGYGGGGTWPGVAVRHKEAVLNTPTMAPHQSPGKSSAHSWTGGRWTWTHRGRSTQCPPKSRREESPEPLRTLEIRYFCSSKTMIASPMNTLEQRAHTNSFTGSQWDENNPPKQSESCILQRPQGSRNFLLNWLENADFFVGLLGQGQSPGSHHFIHVK